MLSSVCADSLAAAAEILRREERSVEILHVRTVLRVGASVGVRARAGAHQAPRSSLRWRTVSSSSLHLEVAL
jgi:hypothetical protein